MSKPLIGLPLCRWQLTDRDIGWFHLVGEKYIQSVTGFGAFPLMIPAFADDLDMDTVLDSVSGTDARWRSAAPGSHPEPARRSARWRDGRQR